MFIQTEETPNPDTLKFLPGRTVLTEGTASFDAASDLSLSPFAKRLLAIEGIQGVFLGSDFISVSKAADQDWYLLKPSILGIMMETFLANQPIILPSSEGGDEQSPHKDLDPLSLQIKDLLDTRVRPAVAQDGGDIVFHSFEDGIVYVRLQGACSGCPSSTATLKAGIESMLKYYVPEVIDVRAID